MFPARFIPVFTVTCNFLLLDDRCKRTVRTKVERFIVVANHVISSVVSSNGRMKNQINLVVEVPMPVVMVMEMMAGKNGFVVM